MSINNSISLASPVMATYSRFPVTVVKGKGSYVWDEKGTQYLDFTSGIATCNLGHVPDVVKEALEEQLQNLWHCSNLYNIPNQQQLAALLTANSCGDQVFFCNSGAEANEAAIKLARRYANKVKGKESPEIVTFQQSFHGRTLATLSATGQEKIQQGFFPLVSGFNYLPFNDEEALELLYTLEPAAVLLELVQGEGGVIPANQEWVSKLAKICQEREILLMVDEIQTGIGRTGTLFAYEQYGIEPDVISIAKGLGSGFPIGAIIAKEEAAKGFDPGSHGSTFGGNPLATAAGLATVTHITESNLLNNANEISGYLDKKLQELKEKYSFIKDIRGLGLLKGMVVETNALEIVQKAIENHLLILTAGPNVVRILPPLTVTKAEINEFIKALEITFQGIEKGE
ncbi:acetylornithine transaminase [Bacillus sp. ISL-40]|uniref:acetylornithine transaminase n=1 Tax=unclassified Bacillus (in: firmicutes) TaxID=185979 RepID=UPI001BE6ED35|nr:MULTISPECIES: acetylornithine transaminase [unclassified Bacillus (in: firmicutes)]MBT2699811.1 acetylornithine transaminase [Bacillus sp. ISL-40]MBT2721925.1 acetylornithine transaminase [Bacillus sp. ISL-46]MBT2743298.1 acetylornithine transaminase [Bacillus sp. ISL-77]